MTPLDTTTMRTQSLIINRLGWAQALKVPCMF
jgi:hypothetical protein